MRLLALFLALPPPLRGLFVALPLGPLRCGTRGRVFGSSDLDIRVIVAAVPGVAFVNSGKLSLPPG